jgi:hypothetical protein
MNNEHAAAEAEIRAVLAEDGSDSDPLKPLALFLLTAVMAGRGSTEEGEQLVREAEDCARRRGSDYDYDRAEGLWNRCATALFRGDPDRAGANEYLELARDLGNARALAGALLMSGMADPDPKRGGEMLAQARELTARTRETWRHLIATIWLGLLVDDPLVPIHALPGLVEQARSSGQRLSLVQHGRNLLKPLATIGRFDAVAVLDGASVPYSVRPALAAEAVTTARQMLGEGHYGQLYDEGHSFSPADLEEYLLRLAAEHS